MKDLRIILLLVIALSSCSEETYYPSGLYGYQVERLLTGGSKKQWFIYSKTIDGDNQSISSCQDSVWRVFEVISSDSITAYTLSFDAECTLYDTTFLGQLSASGGQEYFNDTVYLTLENGRENYMLIDYVTSNSLSLNYTSGNSVIKERLDTSSTGMLSRQVIPLLLGGTSGLSYWELIKLYHNTSLQAISNCEDTTLLFVTESQIGATMSIGVRDTTCEINETLVLGGIREVGMKDEIYFDGNLYLEDGLVNQINLSGLTSDNFTVQYDSITATYRRR